MDQAALYALLSVFIVSLISLIGVFTLRFSKAMGGNLLPLMVSFSAGALLGDVFIHLLPEIEQSGEFTFSTSIYILATIVFFAILEKYLHWHHHHDEDKTTAHAQPLVFINLIADGVHNFIDGLVIAGSFVIDIRLGIATTVAVILHEIPQEIADFGVLIYGGLTRNQALFYNFLSALLAVIGAVVGLWLTKSDNLISVLAALAIGSFIYIATADLIPHLHQEHKQPFSQLFSFLLGIGIMFALLLLN